MQLSSGARGSFWIETSSLSLLYKNVDPLNTVILANSEDPDEMQHYAAFHQGLHCLLRLKQPSVTEIVNNLETFTCDPLKCKMGNPILIVLTCMGKSIRIQRVNSEDSGDLAWKFMLI